MPPSQGKLPFALSIHLDLVRVGASAVVVLHHTWMTLFPAFPLPWPGHQAVVVFFVLSGVLIAQSARRPGLTLREYIMHRAARVLSVAVPAMLLSTAVAIVVGGHSLYAAPAPANATDGVWRIAANLLFVGQCWWLDVDPPYNSPWWSLNFEVWYYATFAAWVFLTGPGRIVASGIILLAAGPKIVLLLPIWLMGAALNRRLPIWRERSAALVFAATALLALILIHLDAFASIRRAMEARWPAAMTGLGGANQFAGDWLLGAVVTLHFAAAANLRTLACSIQAAGIIRAVSNCTFSAYLYHMPLLAIAVLALGLQRWAALAFVAAGIVTLAPVTEGQLTRMHRWMDAVLQRRRHSDPELPFMRQ